MPAKRPMDLKHTGYEIFMALLSVLSVANIAIGVLVSDVNMQAILVLMDSLLSAVFLGDFIYRFSTASSRSHYFFRSFGWADLASCLPFPGFKVLRFFRLAKVYRLMHEYGGRNVGRALIYDRAGSALLSLLFAGVLVLEFGSLAMLRVEQYAPGAKITTASAALWYVIVTISTVGYGDTYPVTNPGRLIGSLIIVIGVGIFGTFTGYLANFFLEPKARRDEEESMSDLERLERIKGLMAQQQTLVEAIERDLQEQKA